jgi:SulP family sulfate permease
METILTDRPLENRFQMGDLWGGMAASAVVLPQALAFGVALLTPFGLDAARGALAGMIGTVFICTAAGITGGTRGLIASPTGPTLVLLTGALGAVAAAGGADILLTMTAIVALTGIFQTFIGLSGGGGLIKYIPYPVVSGFMTGSALLMIKSQLDPMSGAGYDAAWESMRWLPAAAAGATFLAMSYGPRLIRWLPGTIVGLVFGTLCFHLLALLVDADLPAHWLIGALPSIDSLSFDYSLAAAATLRWDVIVGAAIALAILASLDTLLTAVIADVETGARHKARIELTGQGIGNILAGLAGGMAGAGTTGATVVAVRSGARRWGAMSAAGVFVLLIFVGRDIGRLLPIGVLAGVIIHVAVKMIDRDIITWLKQRSTRMDSAIAILVTLVTVVYDLMIAVGAGVAIAIILFIRTQIRTSVVHRRSTAAQTHSTKQRTERERELLDEHGDRIIVYELRGNLFFATADQLLAQLAPDLDAPNWVILHMRRVYHADLTALKIVQQIARRLEAHSGHLIFCNVHRGIGIGETVQATMQTISTDSAEVQVLTFNGKDEALAHAENALLDELGSPPTETSVNAPLAATDLCRKMTDEQIRLVEQSLSTRSVAKGDALFRVGDEGDELFVVLQGEIEIRLPTTAHHHKRLSSCGPGTFFGELAFLIPGPRAADAIAVHDSKLLVLDRDGFARLSAESPDTAIQLLMVLGRIQVENQRWSTIEIQRLSEW